MRVAEAVLTGVHDVTGLPWWLTIGVTTVSVRLAFVPLQIFQSRSIARMSAIKPQMDELTTRMRESSALGTEKGFNDSTKAQKALGALLAKNGVQPWMTMVGAFGQIPVWLTFFFTMRHLVRPDGGLGLDMGGTLWFTDLTMRDPYYILPIVCGGTFYSMVQLGDPGQAPGVPVDERQAMMRTMMKGAAVVMVPATAWFESGVFVYWISTNMFAMTQACHGALARRSRPCKRMLPWPARVAPASRVAPGSRHTLLAPCSMRSCLARELWGHTSPIAPPARHLTSVPDAMPLQTVLLRQPAIREAAGMPPLPGAGPMGMLPAEAAAASAAAGVQVHAAPAHIVGSSVPAPRPRGQQKKGKAQRRGKRR